MPCARRGRGLPNMGSAQAKSNRRLPTASRVRSPAEAESARRLPARLPPRRRRIGRRGEASPAKEVVGADRPPRVRRLGVGGEDQELIVAFDANPGDHDRQVARAPSPCQQEPRRRAETARRSQGPFRGCDIPRTSYGERPAPICAHSPIGIFGAAAASERRA